MAQGRREEEEDTCIHACSEAQGRLTSARCKMNNSNNANSNNANSNNANAAPDLRTQRRWSSWQLHERVALQQAKLKEQEEEEREPRSCERKTSKGPAPEARQSLISGPRLVSGSGRAKKRDDYYVSTICERDSQSQRQSARARARERERERERENAYGMLASGLGRVRHHLRPPQTVWGGGRKLYGEEDTYL